MPKESETRGLNDGRKWWLVGNATDVGISDKVMDRMSRILRRHNWPTALILVNSPAFRSIKHYWEYEDPVQMEFSLVHYP